VKIDFMSIALTIGGLSSTSMLPPWPLCYQKTESGTMNVCPRNIQADAGQLNYYQVKY